MSVFFSEKKKTSQVVEVLVSEDLEEFASAVKLSRICRNLAAKYRKKCRDELPALTMIINGFPDGQGPLYAQSIRAALKDCLHNEVRLSFQSMDAYLTFENHYNDGTPLGAYLCELYYKMDKALTVPKVPAEKAHELLRQLKLVLTIKKSNWKSRRFQLPRASWKT